MFQFFDETIEAIGKAFDLEIQRIVVTVGDVGIEGGMEGGDEPTIGPHAGDRVEQRQPIILRGRKRGIRRSRIVTPAVSRRALPRLDEFVMQKESLQRAAEFRCLLELRLAPGYAIVVRQQHFTCATDEDVSPSPSIRARKVIQIVEF